MSTTGEQIALAALKKEHKRLMSVSERAKKEADEYMNVGSEMIRAHNEFVDVVNGGLKGKAAIAKLDELAERGKKHDRIRKKDFLKLIDKQTDAQFAAEELAREIYMLEFRINARRA